MQDPTDADLLRRAFSLLGRRRSPKKTQAARENAKKGGRPQGTILSEETKAKISATKRRKLPEPVPATSEPSTNPPPFSQTVG